MNQKQPKIKQKKTMGGFRAGAGRKSIFEKPVMIFYKDEEYNKRLAQRKAKELGFNSLSDYIRSAVHIATGIETEV